VLGVGGVGSALIRAWVDGDALRLVKDFDSGGGEPKIEAAIDQLIGSTVIMAIGLQVIIGREQAWREPFGILIRDGGQRLERRPVKGFELRAPGAGQLFEGAMIEVLKQGVDGLVEFGQREESAMAEAGQNPTFY